LDGGVRHGPELLHKITRFVSRREQKVQRPQVDRWANNNLFTIGTKAGQEGGFLKSPYTFAAYS
jgi:hypothetical protein